MTVHPRACGERGTATSDQIFPNGSSPRVRGTRHRDLRSDFPKRFIPARAGNALDWIFWHFKTPVHPRACGERYAGKTTDAGHSGSSPRVRGTLLLFILELRSLRFIPARAGNAISDLAPIDLLMVHPRACGERGNMGKLHHAIRGSSPRVRGTHGRRVASRQDCGFIPARAGNAHSRPVLPARNTVHPRACGERVD